MQIILAGFGSGVSTLCSELQQRGVRVQCTEEGGDVLSMLKHYDFDAVLLQDALIDMSGAEVVRTIRSRKLQVPVVVFLSEDSHVVRASYLDAGADDCVTLPTTHELCARLRAVVRRTRGYGAPRVEVGNLAIHLSEKRVFARGEELALKPVEYETLEFLGLRRGNPVSRERLFAYLHQDEEGTQDVRSIDIMVCHLRKKLRAALGSGDYIETRHGFGYALRAS